MSKKKGKKAPKPAPKKKAPARAKKASASRSTARTTAAASIGHTAQITIFLYKTSSGNKIRTAPQRAYAGPGSIEWTIVNLIDGSNVPVTLTWPDGGPWGKEPIEIRDGRLNRSLDGAAEGRFKYWISGFDAQEDPEVEIPGN